MLGMRNNTRECPAPYECVLGDGPQRMDQICHAIWTTFPGGGGGEARWQHQRAEKVGGRLLKRAATPGRKGLAGPQSLVFPKKQNLIKPGVHGDEYRIDGRSDWRDGGDVFAAEMCQLRAEDSYLDKRKAILSRRHQSVIDEGRGIGVRLVALGPTSFQ